MIKFLALQKNTPASNNLCLGFKSKLAAVPAWSAQWR